jgi:hypothetical protein
MVFGTNGSTRTVTIIDTWPWDTVDLDSSSTAWVDMLNMFVSLVATVTAP